MYITSNPKSKAALKRSIQSGNVETVMSNSEFDNIPENGEVSVEGPHYPKPHTWYARATIENGKVIKIS